MRAVVLGVALAPNTPEMHTLNTLRDQLHFLIEEAESLRVVLPFSPETLVRERPRPDQYAVVETLQLIAWLDEHVRLPGLLHDADVATPPDAFSLEIAYDEVVDALIKARMGLLAAIPSEVTQEQLHFLWRITQEDAEILRHTGSFLLDAQRLG